MPDNNTIELSLKAVLNGGECGDTSSDIENAIGLALFYYLLKLSNKDNHCSCHMHSEVLLEEDGCPFLLENNNKLIL